jgi:hypothetical protein
VAAADAGEQRRGRTVATPTPVTAAHGKRRDGFAMPRRARNRMEVVHQRLKAPVGLRRGAAARCSRCGFQRERRRRERVERKGEWMGERGALGRS